MKKTGFRKKFKWLQCKIGFHNAKYIDETKCWQLEDAVEVQPYLIEATCVDCGKRFLIDEMVPM